MPKDSQARVDQGSLPIGSPAKPTENSPDRSASTPTASPSDSATTGSPSQARPASSSTGPQPGATGAGAKPTAAAAGPDKPPAPFPSLENRKALRALSFSELTDDQRYQLHAYTFGWLAARDLSDANYRAAFGDWYVRDLAGRVEAWERRRLHKQPPYVAPAKQADQTIVRAGWRNLHLRDLTQAERAIAVAEVDETMRRFHAENPRAAARAEKMIRAHIPGRILSPDQINAELGIAPAEEIPPP